MREAASSAGRELFIAGGNLAFAPPRTDAVVLHLVDGVIAGLVAAAPAGAPILDATGHWLAPMLVDAHVHLAVAARAAAIGTGGRSSHGSAAADERMALRSLAREMLEGGVAGALDLGLPERLLSALPPLGEANFLVRSSGPLLTAAGGYPSQSWGRDGYGLALTTAAGAREAVARLAGAGAHAVKLALDRRFPLLAPEVAQAAAREGHARGLRVFAHALDAAAVRAALDAGADVLAHAPTEPLPDDLVREAGARGLHVISTLHALGGSSAQLDNLARLRAAGCAVVYGTDLGNEGTAPGACARELELLAAAGLAPAEIFLAATALPAALLGAPLLGKLCAGAPAHLLALAQDPRGDASALARPAFLMVAGAVVGSAARSARDGRGRGGDP